MSNRCARSFAAFATVVCLCVPPFLAGAQLASVRGELKSARAANFREMWVELLDISHRADAHRVDVRADGEFEFRAISPGEYSLRVTNLNGEPIHEQFVTITGYGEPLRVELPGAKPLSSAPGTISMKQLRHPPTAKAFQAVAAAQRLSEAGDQEKAAAELEKAIRLSPDYADAYNNLAVQHIRMNRFDAAATELQRAIELAGPTPMMLCNLAFAQHKLQRDPEAVANTRAALRLDSSYAQAHLILGSILAMQPATRAESIPHLQRAAETLPSARVTLERARKALQ